MRRRRSAMPLLPYSAGRTVRLRPESPRSRLRPNHAPWRPYLRSRTDEFPPRSIAIFLLRALRPMPMQEAANPESGAAPLLSNATQVNDMGDTARDDAPTTEPNSANLERNLSTPPCRSRWSQRLRSCQLY